VAARRGEDLRIVTTMSNLKRRRRSSARKSLYAALVLVTAAAVGFGGWLGRVAPRVKVFDWMAVDYAADPAVQFLQRYLAINTSLPYGDPPAGAELLADRLRAAGLPVTVERVGEKDVNLWSILEGEDSGAIVLHHHIDVEAVGEQEVWKYPPFRGTIDGPWLYGRGAFDMKSVAVAQLEAFVRLAEQAAARGLRPARSVILLATSGEETGSELGMRWVLRAHPELVGRFGVVLTEGGVVEGRAVDDVKYWGIEFAQKRKLWVTLCGAERERLDDLRRELIAERRSPATTTVSPELGTFLEHYASTRDRADWRGLLADPVRLARDPVALAGMPAYVQSLFFNEAIPRSVEETSGGFELPISVQLVPGAEPEAALAELLPPWRLHGLGVTVYDEGAAGHGSPADHPVVEEIRAVLSAHYPAAPIGPVYLAQTITDARFLRAQGIPAYGFSPFMVLTPEVASWVRGGHANERIALNGFVEGVEIYADLLERLAMRPPAAAGG
jgi:acetylornithine deacetylase/succinyl-diaminopimelate desuccinylase-like protein